MSTPEIEKNVDRRRTFAIISHPDAGKTTLTEKLLLLGGAIQAAGAVKARGDARRARSDWMKVEQERGISVSASAMTFERGAHVFNLVDTPGHSDFSEDTYRTLTAVDAAIMVIDVAKGIESQTRKLFEVCRMRDIPIVTFVNKLDREGRDPFEIMDEIEQELQLEVTPASWPVGMGRDFLGAYDLFRDRLLLAERSKERLAEQSEECNGLEDPKLDRLLPAHRVAALREEAGMARELCPEFSRASFLEGNMTPVYFGSALQTFGVSELLDGVAELCPPPRPQKARERLVDPKETKVSGFIFKIQANMDPKHRDRIAFMRLCSGHFRRGARLRHVASDSTFNVHNPVLFFAQERGLVEEAFAGDIIGIPNHGKLHIGDTLTEGEELHYTGIPSFAPELLQRVRATDPLRAKHLGRALEQIAEEGAARVFRPSIGSNWVVGVVGALQFEVLADRIRTEYDIPVVFEHASLHTARWLAFDDQRDFDAFRSGNEGYLASDHTGVPVFLARNAWHLETTQKDFPKIRFLKTLEQ
jgi:peptide chain release factor 3